MTQYIDWDAEFKAACDIVETVPGLEDTIDTGDLREAGAPCGCWIAYSCSHPSAVGLCDKHKAEMPVVDTMPDCRSCIYEPGDGDPSDPIECWSCKGKPSVIDSYHCSMCNKPLDGRYELAWGLCNEHMTEEHM